MSNKQELYETFLETQQTRMQVRWFRDLPVILSGLTQVIQKHKESLNDFPNFDTKTLPELRILYQMAKDAQKSEQKYEDYRKSQDAVKQMMSKINGWFRKTKVAVGLKVHADKNYFGKAAIPDYYELVVSDSFKVTTNQL